MNKERQEIDEALSFDLEGPVLEVIERLKKETASHGDKYIRFKIEARQDGWADCNCGEYREKLVGVRLENDTEYQGRLDNEAMWEKRNREEDIKKLQELKAKYESQVQ